MEIDRHAPRQIPMGRVVMRPIWHDLLFLHWPVEAQRLQKLLPDGLEIDTFDGTAWVGLVPFSMSRVRPHFLPNRGKWGRFYEVFPELNVRTYVVRDGIPGVWFFSLDAGSALAAMTARAWFKLPYFKARMWMRRLKNGQTEYFSRRIFPPPAASCRVRYEVAGEPKPAEPGTLEHFLVERYFLYSQKRGQLFRGRVVHAPYQLQSAKIAFLRENCVAAAGISRPQSAPHAVFARRVEVEICGLERWKKGFPLRK